MTGVRQEGFGDAGRSLPTRALARFVVLAGAAAPDDIDRLLAAPTGAAAQPPATLDLRGAEALWLRIDLDRAMAAGPRVAEVIDLADFCARLDRCWDASIGAGPARGLLCGGPANMDTGWLTGLLVREAPLEAAVFEQIVWGASAFDWPLRIGLPPSSAGKAMWPALRDGWFRDLYEPVIVRGPRPVDLLVFPGSLSQALRSARRGWQRRASAVIVLGPLDAPNGLEAMRAVAQRWDAAVVAVCGLDSAQGPELVFHVVAELSHNLPLPLAVFKAQQRLLPTADPSLPVVLGDLEFAERNRPLDVARRLADRLRRRDDLASLPSQPDLGPMDGSTTVADLLEFDTPHWDWSAETQGASRLVRVRRSLEQQLGPISLREPPRQEAAMAGMDPPEGMAEASPPPEHEPETAPPRHVKFDLWPMDRSAPLPERALLHAHAEHRLVVFIAEFGEHAHATASTPLDESPLDDREEGHDLTIVYCPLSPVERDADAAEIPPPVSATLHLPRRGTSGRVEFVLSCGKLPAAFRARLIVLHANRALQTLLLTASADGLLRLDAENIYAPGFESPSAEVPADLSFVINESPQGVHGLATIEKGAVSFIDPPGLQKSIDFMRSALGAAMKKEVSAKTLAIDRPETLGLMRTLANHGASILERLGRQHAVHTLEAAQRIQVVEAVDKAFFPAEFLYSGKAPLPTAPLCPNALAALRAGDSSVHDGCAHKNDKNHVCPMAFWGFHKCIERHTANGDTAHVVSVPAPGDERLGPFHSALLAASDIAKKEMTGAKGLPAAIKQMLPGSVYVKSWDDWQQQIRNVRPNLLMLLPHSTESPDFDGIPALEISSVTVASSNLDEEYVHVGEGKGPLVLLLGCSTSMTEVSFLDFVRQFHAAGAPVVIGTLSIIHASQADLVLRRLLEATTDPAHPARRLDEAMLGVRRELLAQGHGIAFTLMAYGHSAWRL